MSPESKSLIRTILNPMLPFQMLLRVYSLCVLMVDIFFVYINTIISIIESVYEFFVPPPMKSLKNETALIIGAGRGIGQSLAIQLSDLGATVICVDINESNNERTVEYIKEMGNNDVHGYCCDITQKRNILALTRFIEKDIGFVTMLFHCCGVPSPRSLISLPPQDIQVTMDLTLNSYIWLIDQLMPQMKVKNHGHIIALTSVAGLSYNKDLMPLSVAQFAVQGLAKSLMEDLRVNRLDGVHITLSHIYPFIVKENSDMEAKIPSYFGTITPDRAATAVLDSVRRNYVEASVPKHMLFLGNVLRVLPRKANMMIRDLLDTGVDFA
ncbi:unnamed protein product [Pieris macdunnoughi]|uniref:Uncharacterized protein n=2 Tax=Pieris macdunnoughi TaxID=345717 RepID=A0A821XV23_9NEOP|nr:unnamed protein product [Pieris macdunnoughi]